MNTFFTSDYHFGHANILLYCKRPWLQPGDTDSSGKWISQHIAKKRVDEMNEAIIKRHNERVKKDDLVFYLGDFCFKSKSGRGEGEGYKSDYYASQLNGKFIFIRGNHDKNNSLNTHIEKVIYKYSHYEVCLVHKPEDVDFRYAINFVGHVHEKFKFERRHLIDADSAFFQNKTTDLINVGVDVHNFYPQTFDELIHSYQLWKRGDIKCTQSQNEQTNETKV